MSSLYFLLPLALAMGVGFVMLFLWAVRQGQFDDLDDAPMRMLQDDDDGVL